MGISEESQFLRGVGDKFCPEYASMRVAIAIAVRIRRVTRSRAFDGFGNFAFVR